MLRIHVLGGLYVSSDGRPLTGAAGQPRRLALLALLAIAGERGVTRDALLAYLWPEEDEERGLQALTQALYALRGDLGSDEAFLGMKDLRLNQDMVTSDVADFRDAASTGDLDRAATIWHGPFLEGFHLPGSAIFERWVEDQRTGLQHDYAALLDQLATRALERGDERIAAGWLRKLAATDPLNARVAMLAVPPTSATASEPLSPLDVKSTILRDTSGRATLSGSGSVVPAPRESDSGPRMAVRIAGVIVAGLLLLAGYAILRALLSS